MDPDFPYLDEHQRVEFPFDNKSPGDEPLAYGGNLSPGMLLSAYEQGFFPWFNPGEDIYWWNPDPRFVLFPEKLHIPKRFYRSVKKYNFTYTMDTAFSRVIEACSVVPRFDQDGTWLTQDMKDGYNELHRLGYAHSVEAWAPEDLPEEIYYKKIGGEAVSDAEEQPGEGTPPGRKLVGGLYGISLGTTFFGESMFSLIPGGSRGAFIKLCQYLNEGGFSMIDCQMETEHLVALGGENIPRKSYMNLLKRSLKEDTLKGSWSRIFNFNI
ncbi:MAG: leucyl/phenylalanyl-tRNA--protein transferase [Spirochaetales bacterium]|nr:leucyl/phenylalanyl-tRNA--protein transferase [Spirochaetales bacterium]